jgi:transposase-like protein
LYKEFIEDAEYLGKRLESKINKIRDEATSSQLDTDDKFKLTAMSSQLERANRYRSLNNPIACPMCFVRSGLEESLKSIGSPSPKESKFRCASCKYTKTIFSK